MSDTDTLTRAEIMAARGTDLWPKPPATPPDNTPKRRCEICKTGIDGAHHRAKTCEEEACKTELRERRQRKAKALRAAPAGTRSGQTVQDVQDVQPAAPAGTLTETVQDVQPAGTRSGQTVQPASSLAEDDTANGKGDDDLQSHARQAVDNSGGDWLHRIEAAAEALKVACATERLAREQRIDAQKRLAEAISKDQAASAVDGP